MSLIKIKIPYKHIETNRYRYWIGHVSTWTHKQQITFYPRERYDMEKGEFHVLADRGDVIRWGCKGDETYHSLTIDSMGKITMDVDKVHGAKFYHEHSHNYSDQKRYINPNTYNDDESFDTAKITQEPKKDLPPAPPLAGPKKVEKQLCDYATNELLAELRTRGIWFEN